MAYNNPYFPANYQPMQYYPQQTQQAVPQPQQMQEPASDQKWVQGEAGAKSYLLAPNSRVTLWDSEAPVIYIKTTNAAGLPVMAILDYTVRDTTQQGRQIQAENDFATKEDVSLLRDEIEALRAKLSDAEGSKKK